MKDVLSNTGKIYINILIGLVALIMVSLVASIYLKGNAAKKIDVETPKEAVKDAGDSKPVDVRKNKPNGDRNREVSYTENDGPLQAADGENDIPIPVEAVRASERILIDRYYSPLFERLDMGDDKLEEFKWLLVERRMAWNDMEQAIRDDWYEGKSLEEDYGRMLEKAYEYDSKLKEFLGEDNHKKYNTYISSLGVFLTDTVHELEEELHGYGDEMINEEQRDGLTNLMADEFEAYLKKYAPEVEGPPGFRIGMREPDALAVLTSNLDELQNRYLAASDSLLSESQKQIYFEVLQKKMEERKEYAGRIMNEMAEISETKTPVLYRDDRDR